MKDIIYDSNFAKKIDQLAFVKGGLLRNFARRSILASDEPWWTKERSPWKISIEHPYAPPDSILPNYWMDRVMDLCENELTNQYFGLTFKDLMKMDPSTFEYIEKRVYDFAKRQSDKMSPELKKELSKNTP